LRTLVADQDSSKNFFICSGDEVSAEEVIPGKQLLSFGTSYAEFADLQYSKEWGVRLVTVSRAYVGSRRSTAPIYFIIIRGTGASE